MSSQIIQGIMYTIKIGSQFNIEGGLDFRSTTEYLDYSQPDIAQPDNTNPCVEILSRELSGCALLGLTI